MVETCQLFFDAYDTEGQPDPSAWLDVVAVSGPPFVTHFSVRYPADREGRVQFAAIQGSSIEINGEFASPPLPQTVVVPALEVCDLSELIVWPPQTEPGRPSELRATWASLSAEAAAAGYALSFRDGAAALARSSTGEVAHRFPAGLTMRELRAALICWLAFGDEG